MEIATPPAAPSEPTAATDPAATKGIVTTEEELDFHKRVRDVCVKAGETPESILYRDTLSYFNVSYGSPTKWFVRLFSNGRKQAITTLVPLEEAGSLASGFEMEEPPKGVGAARIHIDTIDQVWALSKLITRSLEVCKQQKAATVEE